MRAVVQRVSRAKVCVEGKTVGEIGRGILVLLAAAKGDGDVQIKWMVEKLFGLRIFPDESGKMNLDLSQIGGSMLVVSQFTLYGDCRKGKRPSYADSAPSGEAATIYADFVKTARSMNIPVQEGVFGAMMEVDLVNDGPVTLIVDSP